MFGLTALLLRPIRGSVVRIMLPLVVSVVGIRFVIFIVANLILGAGLEAGHTPALVVRHNELRAVESRLPNFVWMKLNSRSG